MVVVPLGAPGAALLASCRSRCALGRVTRYLLMTSKRCLGERGDPMETAAATNSNGESRRGRVDYGEGVLLWQSFQSGRDLHPRCVRDESKSACQQRNEAQWQNQQQEHHLRHFA